MLVTTFVGVFLTIMSFFYHRTYYLQKREKRRIERELKKINDAKTEIEKLIDAAQNVWGNFYFSTLFLHQVILIFSELIIYLIQPISIIKFDLQNKKFENFSIS